MTEVEKFLAARGAADMDHPGGTLLAFASEPAYAAFSRTFG